MLLLTLRDVQHRLVRFIVVTVLAAVVFTLLFLMTGLVEQFRREPYLATRNSGADTWVLPSGVAGPFTATGTIGVERLADVDAADAAPVVFGRATMHLEAETTEVVVIGHEPAALGSPRTDDGRAVQAAGEAVVDVSSGVGIGDAIRLGDRPFTVVGLTRQATVLAGIPLVYVPVTDAQDLMFGSRAVVSGFVANAPGGAAPEGMWYRTADEVADNTLKPLENAISSVDLVRALLWLVAGIIVGAVVYLSALDRQRDFAVLKAVGAGNRALAGGLAIQAVVVAVAAALLGALLQVVVRPLFPLTITVPGSAFVQVPLLAAVVAMVAAAVGMRRVVRSDPAAAFAGPAR
jgi:putative ABC transport system permease protein